MQRDTCIFYRSFLTAVDMLPDMGERFELLMAIIRYSLDQQAPSFSSVTCSIAWELIKPIIDKEWMCYVNGKKGGCPRGTKKPSMLGNKNAAKKSTPNPNKTQTKADKDKDYDKDKECDGDEECDKKETHSMSVVIRPREADNGSRHWSKEDLMVYDDVDEEVEMMLKSPSWKEQVFVRFKFLNCSDELLNEYLERFAGEQKIGSKHHLHLRDAKNHFVNWMIIQEEKLNKINKSDGTDRQFTAQQRIDAEIRRSVDHYNSIDVTGGVEVHGKVPEKVW